MFSGIVEELGQVVASTYTGETARLRIRGPRVTTDVRQGDSVAVNGVCLTVADEIASDLEDEFTADVMQETLNCTTLGLLTAGDTVNLERALRLGDRISGHLVQGHVDATAELIERDDSDLSLVLRISLPHRISHAVIPKASITIDGVSLTVLEVSNHWFSVSLIPSTIRATTLGTRTPGQMLNVEADALAKHVAACIERQVPALPRSSGVS